MSSPVTRKSGTRSKPHVFNPADGRTRLAAMCPPETAPTPSPHTQAALTHLREAVSTFSPSDLLNAVNEIVQAIRVGELIPDEVAQDVAATTVALARALARSRPLTSELDLFLVELLAAGALVLQRPDGLQDERLAHAENLICRLTIQLNDQKLQAAGNRFLTGVAEAIAMTVLPPQPGIH